MHGLTTSMNQTGLGTTLVSSRKGSRELLNTNSSSFNVFHPAVGANSLRHSSHKYTFPKTKRIAPFETFISVRGSRDHSDSFYDLNTTLSKEATVFTKATRDKTPQEVFKRGKDAPSPDNYRVKRLFDKE